MDSQLSQFGRWPNILADMRLSICCSSDDAVRAEDSCADKDRQHTLRNLLWQVYDKTESSTCLLFV